jgi:catechol 2,3-dioxygenase-like lactoylglutathione lyase family enzyme
MIRFDHALIYVNDLPRAVRDYGALGFTVAAGGAHEGGPTGNALVPFADGSYLELIAFRKRSTRLLLRLLARLRLVERVTDAPLARRFALRAARGQGVIDLAVCVDALAPVIDTAQRAGLTIHGPVPGRRAAGDGSPVVWELGIPQDDELPLLITDVTPRELRVAVTPGPRHANGVTGVAGIVLPVRDPAAVAARFRDVLGVSSHVEGGRHSIDIGTTRLALEPAVGPPDGRPASLRLAAGTARRLDVGMAHGAVLDLR